MIQQSEEWYSFRKNRIGASDAAAIYGVSPYMTPYQLMQEKLGLWEGQEKSSSMQAGIDFEPKARELAEEKLSTKFEPDVVVHPEFDWLMASLDGISAGRILLELKLVGRVKLVEILGEGKIPPHFLIQVQHQMLVTRADEVNLLAYTIDGVEITDHAIVKIKRDEGLINEIFEKNKAFYELMNQGKLPEPSEKDYVRIDDLLTLHAAKELRQVEFQIKQLEQRRDQMRSQIAELARHPNAIIGDLKISTVTRTGAIDYKSVPELRGVDLEKYRKKPSTYKTFRFTGLDGSAESSAF